MWMAEKWVAGLWISLPNSRQPKNRATWKTIARRLIQSCEHLEIPWGWEQPKSSHYKIEELDLTPFPNARSFMVDLCQYGLPNLRRTIVLTFIVADLSCIP